MFCSNEELREILGKVNHIVADDILKILDAENISSCDQCNGPINDIFISFHTGVGGFSLINNSQIFKPRHIGKPINILLACFCSNCISIHNPFKIFVKVSDILPYYEFLTSISIILQ